MYKFLQIKKKVCAKDIADEFCTSRQHSHLMMERLLKHEGVGEKHEIIHIGNRKFLVKFLVLE